MTTFLPDIEQWMKYLNQTRKRGRGFGVLSIDLPKPFDYLLQELLIAKELFTNSSYASMSYLKKKLLDIKQKFQHLPPVKFSLLSYSVEHLQPCIRGEETNEILINMFHEDFNNSQLS